VGDERAEAAALERLRTTGETIVDGIAACIPDWVAAQVGRLLDAWGGLDAAGRSRADDDARAAGDAAAVRIVERLRALLAIDPAKQAATPLEIVRTVTCEPTAVLAGLGVPPVVRDAFEERAFPDDIYGLVPHTLGDLGDESLAPLHLAWGMGKAAVLRARGAP
jgi:hypothetical protein